ncbi:MULTISPECIES: hypothetical protein [unclassified Leisingera]|uniref:hypothetical protein n=1 Tax=unclassified Leisingera TaxID=2614906 RepID=UPI001269B9EE|nr:MULTISPECIES: hypothetical protein [unclassified Leisingera]
MAAVTVIWLLFGAVWLAAFYNLARARQAAAAIVASVIWLMVLVLLAGLLLFAAETGRQTVLSLYFIGHLVYGLCSLAGWNLGRKRRWRRKVKSFFRRCVAALPDRNRLRS